MKEKWKAINGWEELYEVSNLGRVKSLRTSGSGIVKPNLILKQRANRNGYLYVNLSFGGKYKTNFAHRLVGEHFVENAQGKPMINHKNGLKHDNRFSNLEWVTAKENINHARRTGLNTYIPESKSGEDGFGSVLTNKQAIEARAMYAKGGISQKKVAKKFNVSQAAISRLTRRETYPDVWE